jgi:hypothetical protein
MKRQTISTLENLSTSFRGKSGSGIRPGCAVYHITLLTLDWDRASLLLVVVGPVWVEQDIRVEKERSMNGRWPLKCRRVFCSPRLKQLLLVPLSLCAGVLHGQVCASAPARCLDPNLTVSHAVGAGVATPAVRTNDVKYATQYLATLTGVVAGPVTVTVADGSGLSVVKTVIAT